MLIFESTFPEDFREPDVKRILDDVMAGKFCQLVCIPGGGKATILRLLAHNRNVLKFHLKEKEKNLRFIYLNLFELTDYSDAQIAKFILLAMDQKTPDTEDPLVLIKLLTETVNKLADKGTHLVFLFDHFDEYQNKLPRTFFQSLKSLTGVAKYKFAVVFATRRDLIELVDENITRDFWNFFTDNAIYLKIYDEKALKFLFDQVEKVLAKKLTDDQKKKIVDLTGGHAKLTKITSELILSENIALDQDQLLQNQQVRAALFELWLFLTAQEQHALHHLSNGEKTLESTVKETLIKLDLVNNQGFTIALFGEFVKEMTDITLHKISFDAKTGEITKGESIISELLSPQEYRLMKFLIERENRIVERDELISTVWPNVAVTEAVSDEAIDQMVLRVRKKIEDEPNNPKHLLTVKGRGLRFVP